MAACAENSIIRQWKDCGSYAELQLENGWFWPLYCLFHPQGPDYNQHMAGIFPHALLRVLGRCDDEGLLTGHESFDIGGLGDLEPGKELTVTATSDDGETKEFKVKARVDSPVEVEYLRNGGILHTVLRQFLKEGE